MFQWLALVTGQDDVGDALGAHGLTTMRDGPYASRQARQRVGAPGSSRSVIPPAFENNLTMGAKDRARFTGEALRLGVANGFAR